MRRSGLTAVVLGLAILSGMVRAEAAGGAVSLAALDFAMSRQGDAYVWGGQSPGAFDCSGLILWSYERAMRGIRIPKPGRGYALDATMDHLWRYASQHVPPSAARPGDVVFITGEDGRITHGGLVISVSDTEVEFVNASSYYGEVVVDTWPLKGEKRGQRVVGFGRLIVLPGRRPPMPERTSSLSMAVPFAGDSGTLLLATVSDDDLQSELLLSQPLGPFALGGGYWQWRDGWRGDQFIAGGTDAFAFASMTMPVGRLQTTWKAIYSEAGWSYHGEVTADWVVHGIAITASAGYRHWAPDPWYSGPMASVGVTF